MRALVALVVAGCLVLLPYERAMGGAHPSTRKRAAMTHLSFEDAVEKLASPKTWCEGAAALGATNDARAVFPLVRAYERRAEGLDVTCLLDALHATLPRLQPADLLAQSNDADDRRALFHAMELVPDVRWMSVLEQGANESTGKLQKQALRSLAAQKQTPAWMASMGRLLDSSSAVARHQAIESLGRRHEDDARSLLRTRAAKETDAGLKAAIDAALAQP